MAMRTLHGVTLECMIGDIVDQPDVEAVVNAANAQLRTGGGVAGAIHRAAGAGLEEECLQHAPIQPGEAVITGAHALPNRYVIHCLGPVYGHDEPADELLGACYRNALRLAEDKQLSSIAFPAISTGAFGYPMQEAAQVAFRAIQRNMPELATVTLIRFVLHDEESLRIHDELLQAFPSEAENQW